MDGYGKGAHEAWDKIWARTDDENRWTRPETEVVQLIPRLREGGVGKVLDLGSGIGRHTRLLSDAGFEVVALDGSAAGLARTPRPGRLASLITCVQHDLRRALPFDDATFDFVLAWNSVYHGTDDQVRATVAEVARVLRPGGLYQCTMLSKRDECHGTGVRMSANAYAFPGKGGDNDSPHFYCDGFELLDIHRNFELLSAVDSSHRVGSCHWHAVFERVGVETGPAPRYEEGRTR